MGQFFSLDLGKDLLLNSAEKQASPASTAFAPPPWAVSKGFAHPTQTQLVFLDLAEKYAAVFQLPNGRQRTVRFGTGSNYYVSNPRKTARDRAAYIARHRVNENHNDPLTPGALSRWLLWGESRSLARNRAAFRRPQTRAKREAVGSC